MRRRDLCIALASVLSATACDRTATLEVILRGPNAELPAVTITARSHSGDVLAAGHIRLNEQLLLLDLPPGQAVVEALLLTASHAGYAARRITLRPGRNVLTFQLGRDLVLTPLIRAEDPPPRAPSPALAPELGTDRRVAAVLELDWLEGTRKPLLAVETRAGTLRLEELLAEVSLDLTTVWSDAIPRSELGPGWPGETRLAELLARYRNVTVQDEVWHLHLLLAPQPEPDLEVSLVVDPTARTGAVVFLPPSASEAQALHAVVHEIGHLLNLPHPWELGPDTRSVMSYPWRWPDWDWADPSVYRFDPAARHNLLHAPDECLRPGAGPFGACWMTRASAE